MKLFRSILLALLAVFIALMRAVNVGGTGTLAINARGERPYYDYDDEDT